MEYTPNTGRPVWFQMTKVRQPRGQRAAVINDCTLPQKVDWLRSEERLGMGDG
jgi:hypothetical protein